MNPDDILATATLERDEAREDSIDLAEMLRVRSIFWHGCDAHAVAYEDCEYCALDRRALEKHDALITRQR